MAAEHQPEGQADNANANMGRDDIGDHREGREIEDPKYRREDEHHADIGGDKQQQDKRECAQKEQAGEQARPVDVIGHPRKQDDAGEISEAVNAISRRTFDQREPAGDRVGNKIDIAHPRGGEPAQRERAEQQQECPVGEQKPQPVGQRVVLGRLGSGCHRRVIVQRRLEPQQDEYGQHRQHDAEYLIGLTPPQRCDHDPQHRQNRQLPARRASDANTDRQSPGSHEIA